MNTFFKGIAALVLIGFVMKACGSSSDGSPVEMDEDTAAAILDGTASAEDWEDYYSIAQDLGEACLELDVKEMAMSFNNGWTDGNTFFSTIVDDYTDNPTPTVFGTNAFGGQTMHFTRRIAIQQRDGSFFAECEPVE